MSPSVKVAVYVNESGGHRNRHLGAAMAEGFRRHSCQVAVETRFDSVIADLAVAYGWRNRDIFAAYRGAGGHYLYLDLGYWQRKPPGKRWDGYHKVALDDWCPSKHMWRGRGRERFGRLDVRVDERRSLPGDAPVIIAGMSARSAAHHGFAPETWERAAVATLHRVTRRPLIYRPKPSWDGARPIAGAAFDKRDGDIDIARSALSAAYALVTHHSNAAVDAIAAGLPVYCEAGIGRLLSMPDLSRIDIAPPRALEERAAFCADVAWCQWTPNEMHSGECWAHYRELL